MLAIYDTLQVSSHDIPVNVQLSAGQKKMGNESSTNPHADKSININFQASALPATSTHLAEYQATHVVHKFGAIC